MQPWRVSSGIGVVRTDGSWKTHREYFEIDFHIATNTVKFWIQVLNQHNVEPGAKLDPAVLEALAAELDGLGRSRVQMLRLGEG